MFGYPNVVRIWRPIKISLIAMSMECCISSDNTWYWRITFGTTTHSAWAILENIVAVTGGEGARTVHGVAYIDDLATTSTEYGTSLRVTSRSMLVIMVLVVANGCATIVMIGKIFNIVLNDVPIVDVNDVDTLFGDRLGIDMAVLEGEWTTKHYMIVEDTDGFDVIIHEIDMYQDFQVIFHMREVAFVDSLEITFYGMWKGRVANWGTILHYAETISTNMWTVV